MKEYTISQQYALVGLDGQDSLHPSSAKYAVIRGIEAAKCLDRLLEEGKEDDTDYILTALKEEVDRIRFAPKKQLRLIEKEITAPLMADDLLEEIPDLLACDINYATASVSIKVYRSSKEIWQSITEGVRAESLEEGPVSLEGLALLWLFRESGCIHDFFSIHEQEILNRRLNDLAAESPLYRGILELEFHRRYEKTVKSLLDFKKNVFKNPYLEGINLLFPFIERRQAIFIDMVILGTTVSSRRLAALSYLSEKGHYVEEIPLGEEVLLKIDNGYYRIFPSAKLYRLPVQGVSLVPAYR